MVLQALQGSSGLAKGDNSGTLCSKNASGPEWPRMPGGTLWGEGLAPWEWNAGSSPSAGGGSALQLPGSLEVIWSILLPPIRMVSHVPAWWWQGGELRRHSLLSGADCVVLGPRSSNASKATFSPASSPAATAWLLPWALSPVATDPFFQGQTSSDHQQGNWPPLEKAKEPSRKRLLGWVSPGRRPALMCSFNLGAELSSRPQGLLPKGLLCHSIIRKSMATSASL